MTKLSISLLGTYALQLDGEPVTDLASGKVQGLLTCLLLEPDRPHSREHLAGLLWPESTESGARNSLRTALYRLRALIGDHDAVPPLLLITHDTLRLNPDAPIRSDVGIFGERFAEAQNHTHPDPATCMQCAATLAEAVTLYRGDLLPTFSLDSAEFENWLVTRREALHRQALDALNRLAETHLARGEHDLALDYARRQIELEPWRESAHRQAMQALTLSGQRAAAIAQYEMCRTTLETELGIEPEAATIELHTRIRRGELAPPPATATVVGRDVITGSAFGIVTVIGNRCRSKPPRPSSTRIITYNTPKLSRSLRFSLVCGPPGVSTVSAKSLKPGVQVSTPETESIDIPGTMAEAPTPDDSPDVRRSPSDSPVRSGAWPAPSITLAWAATTENVNGSPSKSDASTS